MSDNLIELKSVGDLLGKNFFIPNYQRGYRWKPQQVNDLLNDINEFIELQKKSEKNDGFYCIQSLVVKENIADAEKSDYIDGLHNIQQNDDVLAKTKETINKFTKWEVIDGQQRLTTIYILLSYLGEKNPYKLQYETRSDSADFLQNIATKTNYSNIDFYHMYIAYKAITDWFEPKDENGNVIKGKKKTEADKSYFKETLLNLVKFIWYESTEEDPIKVFTRLNIGKISLTNAELIKALFLNRSNFSEKEYASIRLKQQEIASEWDKIEYTLQNDEFWLFLNQVGYDKPTRIDMIFDLICEQDRLGIGTANIGTDQYSTFRYFYQYFKSGSASIKDCWSKVKNVFQIFEEWYNDLELYHYVGYLVDQDEEIPGLLTLWTTDSTSKQVFIGKLKEKIEGKLSKCKDLSKEYETSGNPKTQCKPLLLLHNIQTVINQNNNSEDAYKLHIFYKFPFHLYKLENWDVEHIDSNTENDFEDEDSRKEYLLNVYLGVDENLKNEITDYFNANDEQTHTNIFNTLKDRLPKPSSAMTDEQKNQICNFTLLDSSTNRSYGNSIFPAKRRIIIGKDQGKLIGIPKPKIKDGKLETPKEEKAGSSFIPPCTKQVFMKYYSSVSSSPTEYTREDAKMYLLNINKVLSAAGFIDDQTTQINTLFGNEKNNEGGNE